MSFNPKSADRIFCMKSFKKLQAIHPKRIFNLILVDRTIEDIAGTEVDILCRTSPMISHLDFNIGAVLSNASLGRGKLY